VNYSGFPPAKIESELAEPFQKTPETPPRLVWERAGTVSSRASFHLPGLHLLHGGRQEVRAGLIHRGDTWRRRRQAPFTPDSGARVHQGRDEAGYDDFTPRRDGRAKGQGPDAPDSKGVHQGWRNSLPPTRHQPRLGGEVRKAQRPSVPQMRTNVPECKLAGFDKRRQSTTLTYP
jgi:hypothetical protein